MDNSNSWSVNKSLTKFRSVYSRDKNGKGTIFVKLAPIDLKKIQVNPTSPSNLNLSSPSTSGGSIVPMISPGLGGVRNPGLTQRFSRLWPTPTSTSGYSGISSNILDSFQDRKR